MKHNAIVGNIGHFDNEIEIAALEASDAERVNIKPQVDEWRFPDGHSIVMLSEGRLLNLGNATGHPELRDVELVHQPGDRPDRALRPGAEYEAKQVYVLPKHLDEKVARLHLDALGRRPHRAERRPGRLPGHPGRGPLQARPLPLLAHRAAVGGAALRR